MNVSRRQCLQVAAGSSVLALTGCARVSTVARRFQTHAELGAPSVPVTDEVRLLNRAGFGPSPQDMKLLKSMGKEAWVDQQLAGTAIEDPILQVELRSLDVEVVDGMDLRDLPVGAILTQLQQAAILRARYSRNQLTERLVDFWSNHFNVYGRKGLAAYRQPRDESQVIRKHALGHFPDMLMASAKSPAMLGYLDNRLSVRGRPNENYAREIMELHSLGIHGGYTQQDIHEVARCFTGWTVEDRFLRRGGTFRFAADLHDTDEKTVLGIKIPSGRGIEDGEQVVGILSMHPSTAHFIAAKLCRYFLGTDDPGWVNRTAKTYLDTRGDIPSMVKPMLVAEDLMTSRPKLKRPFDYLVSSLRATDSHTDGGPAIVNELQQMGQPLYQWPMPDGYPDKTDAWSGGLLPRWNFSVNLAQGAIRNTTLDVASVGGKPFDPAHAASAILQSPSEAVSDVTRAIQGLEPRLAIAAILSAPEFQWR